jgi:hypothetical protein
VRQVLAQSILIRRPKIEITTFLTELRQLEPDWRITESGFIRSCTRCECPIVTYVNTKFGKCYSSLEVFDCWKLTELQFPKVTEIVRAADKMTGHDVVLRHKIIGALFQ